MVYFIDLILFYEEYIYQLGAYFSLVNENHYIVPEVCMSVIISSNENNAGYVKAKEWSIDELFRGMDIFKTVLELWRLIKKFDFEPKE